MDPERFDRITRTLATGQSRRGFLKTLTGAAMGGVLATAGVGAAAAKPGLPACKAPNTKCGKGKTAVCCDSSQVCASGACTTPPPPDCADVGCPSSGECYSPGICSNGSCSAETFKDPGVGCSGGRTCNGAGTCTCGATVDCNTGLGDNQCTTTQCIEGLCYNDIHELNHTPCTNPLGGGGAGTCCAGACWAGPCQ